MEIYLASPRGFCAGVVLAIDLVEIALEKYGAPVYVKHQIVHNPVVVSEVESKGAITVENVSDVPDNSVVVFSAHGSPPSDYKLGALMKSSKRINDMIKTTTGKEWVIHYPKTHEELRFAKFLILFTTMSNSVSLTFLIFA